MLSFYLLAMCLIIRGINTIENYIIVEPERQVATLNSVVTLQCRVKVVDKYEVHWIKDGFGLGNTRADVRQYGKLVNNQHRYDLPFNLDEGEYDLRITDINLTDEGVFYCQSVVDGRAHSSRKVTVQVLIPSEKPQFIQLNNGGKGPREVREEKNPIIVNDGDLLVIKCIAKNGRPGPMLHWFLNDNKIPLLANGDINGTLIGNVIVTHELSDKNGKLYNTESKLSMKINSLKNGNWLKCLAENQGYENEKSKFALAQIEVHTIPIVQIELHPKRSDNVYVENDVVEFSCTANGRPNSFYWKWYIDNTQIENIVDSKYKLQITRSHDRATIKCVAISTREGSKSIKIHVKYGPKFENNQAFLYPASIGEQITMTCPAVGNPTPSIYWQRHLHSEIIERGSVLVRKNIQEEDFGHYTCTAKAADFTPITKNAYLAKKKKPFIKRPTLTYGREGQSARLSCTVESVPLPTNDDVRWIFRNKVLPNSQKYKMSTDSYIGGVMVILQIMAVQQNDFGYYNCTVKTDLGQDTATVVFMKKGETPVLMIIGATIIFLFILLVSTVVLCICQRRKLKDDYLKGNPSSPEIPLHHEAKSTLIDSDCHCNPNLYSWMPQPFNMKLQNDLINKMHYQDTSMWPPSHEIETCYPNSGTDSMATTKSLKTKHENINTPILYNMQTISPNTLNRYSRHLPFVNLPLPNGKDSRFCDATQCSQYLYGDMLSHIGEPLPEIHHMDQASSPIYVVKKPANKSVFQFSADNFPSSKPIIKTKVNSCSGTMEMYSDQPNNKLVSDYATNI